MTTIDNTLNQLNSIPKDNWNKLFDLIPRIEVSDDFGMMTGGNEIAPGTFEMPSWDGTDITLDFVKIAYELKLVIDFDWMAWAEGKTMLDNKNQDFDCLDLLSLCKLLTRIIRADKFNDGYLVGNFENGNILKILRAIKHNRDSSSNAIHPDARTTGITDIKEQFIWLAYGEVKKYAEISKMLNVDRKDITKWEKDKKDEAFLKLKDRASSIRKIFTAKKISHDFNYFKDWYLKLESNKKCAYCNITEDEISILWEQERKKNKELSNSGRGRKLELDRKQPDLEYENLNNIVYACYWCNNAKTDTFTHEEFLEVGKTISKIWKQRLAK
ncbi:MAG: hypothetical protein KA285_08690 [Bacteroidia bacterium]|nr:hypothetical protein [Bacteroidia bacterium]